jgi:hypothetical protein
LFLPSAVFTYISIKSNRSKVVTVNQSKMSDGGAFQLQILDGTNLRDLDLSSTLFDRPVTGAQLLDIAHSRASLSLFDLPLPDPLKTSALNRLRRSNSDAEPVLSLQAEYEPAKASEILKLYIAAIADELKGLLSISCVVLLIMHYYKYLISIRNFDFNI